MSLAIQRSVRHATTAAGFPMSGRTPVPLSPSSPQSATQSATQPPTQPPAQPPVTETQLERLVKLVPADVVILYIPAIGLGTLTTWPYYALAVTIGATVLVPVLLYLDARAANHRVPLPQYILRTLAFIAWAFVISEPLGHGHVSAVIPALLSLVLPVFGERLLR